MIPCPRRGSFVSISAPLREATPGERSTQQLLQLTGRTTCLPVGIDATMSRCRPRAQQTASNPTTRALPGALAVSESSQRSLGHVARPGRRWGCSALVTTVFLLAAGAAKQALAATSPARSGGWPSWMAGPLESLRCGHLERRLSGIDADHVRELPGQSGWQLGRCRCARSQLRSWRRTWPCSSARR